LIMKIAILGGTGPEGSGLGLRWAAAGHDVIIGSRQKEKGERVASELQELLPDVTILGTDNLTAASQAEVIVLAVPYEAQGPTLQSVRHVIAGKLFITVVAPLGSPKGRVLRLPSNLSAAEEAQRLLGDAVRVVAAFQNVSAVHLGDLDYKLDCDVLVCGDRSEDKKPVQNASAVEGMTAVLYAINVIHKVKSAGIRITGIEQS
jgi:NADPH-dependent F420 reductase